MQPLKRMYKYGKITKYSTIHLEKQHINVFAGEAKITVHLDMKELILICQAKHREEKKVKRNILLIIFCY